MTNWLCWIDIETTGLDINNCKILQLMCILTSYDLRTKYIFPEFTLKCDEETLETMDEWCKKHHGKSGLLEKVKNSNIEIGEAEESLIMYLNQHIKLNEKVYIAGNSVHFDKKFLDKYMPNLMSKLSYRIVDVSSLALICRELNIDIYDKSPEKKYSHTAQEDLLESINEYKYYIENFLKTKKMIF